MNDCKIKEQKNVRLEWQTTESGLEGRLEEMSSAKDISQMSDMLF